MSATACSAVRNTGPPLRDEDGAEGEFIDADDRVSAKSPSSKSSMPPPRNPSPARCDRNTARRLLPASDASVMAASERAKAESRVLSERVREKVSTYFIRFFKKVKRKQDLVSSPLPFALSVPNDSSRNLKVEKRREFSFREKELENLFDIF